MLYLERKKKHLQKKVSYFEDFDLAAGRMHMLHVFPMFIGGECVHQDTKWHSFLSTMLLQGELSADAVDLRRQKTVLVCWSYNSCRYLTRKGFHLDENRSIFDRIPEELNSVEVQRM